MITFHARARLGVVLSLATSVCASAVARAASPSSDAAIERDAASPSSDAAIERDAALLARHSPLHYSLPWQLRPVTIGSFARADSVVAAFNDANGNLDIALTAGFTVSHPITPDLAPMIRMSFVRNDAPGAALDGSSLGNVLVGITYARRLSCYRLALFGASTLPIGTGVGDPREVPAARANVAAIKAHPVDGALFAVNYAVGIAGADFAYIDHGFTAQVEATLLQYIRVRGEGPSAMDRFRTDSVLGLHLGYFIGSHFSLGADLRYERWLSRPATVNATGGKAPVSDSDMDAVTLAAGPRLHIAFGDQGWIRPGFSIARGFDRRGFGAPLLTPETTAVQVDVPITF